MEDKKRKELLQKIEKELGSKDETVVTSALKQTQKHGDASLIVPLLRAFRDANEGKLKDAMAETLNTIKLSEAEEIYMEALEKKEFASIQENILSFTWNAGFQPVESVDLITRIAIEGDYMTGVEAMTLLDSMPGPLDEESLMQGLIIIRQYLLDYKDEGHPNYDIGISIYDMLSRHERDA